MSSIPWVALTVLVGLAFAALAFRAVLGPERPREEPGPEGRTPLTFLQKVSWWTLAAGASLVLAVVLVLLRFGVSAWWEDPAVRLPITGLMVTALVASGIPVFAAAWRVKGGRGVVDERDQAIISRAPRVQGVAILVCQGLWTAALMEAFRATGQVPVPFVVLLFWSCLLAYALALPVGILLGYRWR